MITGFADRWCLLIHVQISAHLKDFCTEKPKPTEKSAKNILFGFRVATLVTRIFKSFL